MASLVLAVAITGFVSLVSYLWHVNRGMSGTPPEALRLSPNRWTKSEILNAYEKAKKLPSNVRDFLPPKLGRRYIVIGGSGLVGGWIVQHLLWRGEDPSAIRILDFEVPSRPEVQEQNLEFIRTDVSDKASVNKAFEQPWSSPRIAALPLTVFHTVAYIRPSDRAQDFLPRYVNVNINGTQNVLDASRIAKATCFIATSSGSIGVKPPKFFLPPWRRWPENMVQKLSDTDPRDLSLELSDFGSCYAYSKAGAEFLVGRADDIVNGFRTGCIRPGHAIYGHGMDRSSNLCWDYLRRGGTPSWLGDTVCHLVNAQNVSIAHLAFESRLVSRPPSEKDLGGRTYYVTDPNNAITYGDLYNLLGTLVHPATPVKFPPVPPIPLLLLAYTVEFYALLRHRYLGFLPEIQGDLSFMMPAIFNMSTTHVFYNDTLAREELGYPYPISTLEGLSLNLLDWNRKVEEKMSG